MSGIQNISKRDLHQVKIQYFEMVLFKGFTESMLFSKELLLTMLTPTGLGVAWRVYRNHPFSADMFFGDGIECLSTFIALVTNACAVVFVPT